MDSCTDIEMGDGRLRATCRKIDGGWVKSELYDPSRCSRGISNWNGQLTCNDSTAPPPRDWGLTIGQFQHTAWGPKEGVPGAVQTLAQTSDGYLWLGGPDGLFRFDGVAFERYQPQSGGPFPVRPVSSLLALPNGDLWIAFFPGVISLLRNGNATNYTTRDGVPNQLVSNFTQDRDETIWAATEGGLMRLEDTRWKEVGEDWSFPGKSAHTVFLDRQGTLWVSTDDTLVFLPLGARHFQPTGIRVGQVIRIAQAPNGKLWMAEVSRSVRPIPLSDKRQPPDDTEIQVGSQGILFDSDGALWISSVGDGLRRSPLPEQLKGRIAGSSNAVESFTAKDGLSDDLVRTTLQDREGNIWFGTNTGLDRFHKTSLVPVVFPFKALSAVLAPGDAGDVWVKELTSMVLIHGGNADPGHPFPREALYPNYAYRDPQGAIWWICPDAIYRYDAGSYTKIALPPSFPKPHLARAVAATTDGSGTLWLSDQREGLFYWKKGVWHQLKIAPELAKLVPRTAFTDWMGRAWFGYVGGTVIVLKDENIQKAFHADESPVGNLRAIHGRGRHIWVAGQLGLAFFDGNRFRRIVPADAEAFGSVLGVVEASNGSLWLAENGQVIEIAATEIQQVLGDPSHRVKYRIFDSFDGLPGSFAAGTARPREFQGTDGLLWFATSSGLAWIDPANVSTNTIPPPVSIRSVNANGRESGSLANLVLPPRTTDLQISYTALSLSVPEKVRFRYLLEGVDKDWQDAGTRREAFYNRLGPGKYHFRVLACNNDGVWNNVGAVLDFKIAPAWFQTIWFQAFCGLVFLFLLWSLYQLRVKQLQRQFAIGLEARVDERTRIARELHDTLLQDLHGAMFQFQAARNLMPRRPEEAMQSLDEAIGDTKKALAESRDAIQGLRAEPLSEGNIAELLIATSRELAHVGDESREPPKFDLIEEGERRTLSTAIHDELCRIAIEILRNAYRHAEANRIETEIRYEVHMLRLRIRDDGKGIEANVLEGGGRLGHWGIRGIRERAERLGAQIDFWSEAGAGTEVQVAVPASIAYKASQQGFGLRLLPKVRNRARRS